MKDKLSLGGFVMSPAGRKVQLPVVENPSEDDVRSNLELVTSSGGYLSLWRGEEDVPGECSINLYCDDGRLYAECTEIPLDGVRIVYRTHDPDLPAGRVPILGQIFSAQSLIANPILVRQLFLSFLSDRGRVPAGFNQFN